MGNHPYPAKAVGDAIGAAIDSMKQSGTPRRHPLEVTSDRIGDAIYRYGDRLDGSERDALSEARTILESLVEGS